MTVDASNPRSGAAEAARPNGTAGAAAGASRISPRSPRAALEPERMAQPARPSKRARHPIVVVGNAILTIIVLAALVGGVAIAIGKQRFETAGPLERERIVNIPRGLGIKDIAELLQREGVIDQPWVFMGGVVALKARDELKYGEYLFPRQASLRDVVDTLTEGKVIQHHVTIPEGLTSEQIVARLLESDILSGPVKEIPKEGTLLPETYRFTRGTTREQAIARIQQAQKRAAQEAWERRAPDLPIQTLEQLIVLASIIEKETGRADERGRVAAVFINRLKQKMKLQSDPTIIYGLVGGKGTLGRPIMRSEIEQPTPYNTYVITGLPPGPIANPGRAALEAAANPSRTREIYFVADGTGAHAFAENYEQHQRNVARLRQIEQQQKDPLKPAPDAAASSAASAFAPTGAAPAATAPPAPTAPTPSPRPQQGKSKSQGGTRQ
jgi:UPF0755 protein